MKVSELKEKIADLDGDNDLFIEVDGKMYALEILKRGQFFKSQVLAARVDFDVFRAEQTLVSVLQYQREDLTGLLYERIERAMGKERLNKIIIAFDEHEEKRKKELEENKDLIEEITESINRQEAFEDEAPAKAKKKIASKAKKLGKTEAEKVLGRFYSGDKSDDIETVKQAKVLLGENKAKAIFDKVRNK
jgi:hypothetical protein